MLAVVGGIFLFSFCYILPTLFTKIPGPGCYNACLGRTVYKLVKTTVRRNKYYIIFYKSNLTLIISFIIPFALLVVFHTKMALKCRKSALRVNTLKTRSKSRKTLKTQTSNSSGGQTNTLQAQVRGAWLNPSYQSNFVNICIVRSLLI